MNTKIKKITALSGTCLALALILGACQGQYMKNENEVSDCSAVFETKYVDSETGAPVSKARRSAESKVRDDAREFARKESKTSTVCKILELKVDESTKCELVGSDKIDKLSRILDKNKDDRIVVSIPESKINDLRKMASNYLDVPSFDIKKYTDSDLVKNLDFPYKGMRCVASGKTIVVWVGDKRVLLTVNM